jgi:CpXC protein
MSVFQMETVTCPGCGQSMKFHVNYSVNADRRPDFRDAILDGTFQRQACPSCGKSTRLEPEMTYFNVGRGQWLLVRPAGSLADWPALEEQARATFETAYGPGTPPAVREMGRSLKPRVTFGWSALREKLLCAELGLDDVTLELLKMALLRSLNELPLADDVELRLTKAEGDELVLRWIKAASEQPLEELRVPKSLYDDIVAAPGDWKELRAQLTAGPFVDVHRLLVPAEEG